MEKEPSILQYIQLSSFIQPSFWIKLSELKINVDKLSENSRNIWGYFTNIRSHWSKLVVEVDSTSFNTNFNDQKKFLPIHGKIFNKNTIEQFKNCNKNDLINNQGQLFMEDLKNGAVLENPSLLNFFFVLSFSDLKHYKFYYWFAFPVPKNLPIFLNEISPISSIFSQSDLNELCEKHSELSVEQKSFFLIVKNKSGLKIEILRNKLKEINYKSIENGEIFFAFADYNIDSQKLPRSQLKNYLILILYYCPFLDGKKINIIAFSLEIINSLSNCSSSLIFNLTMPENVGENIDLLNNEENNWVGWEKNERNQLGPRLSNMKNSMDPLMLAEENVDLNLKLMKWRVLPNIDLDKIKNTKCLLLGSGTLGCSVARVLLGWGVRFINFVDNSTVSFSNPVRQCLFTYEDSVNNKPKAVAAAENLKKIFPSVNSESYQFTIPMPGHSISDQTLNSVRESVEKLENLIKSHDVIFLLMDSRESRWLPTLLGSFYNKIVINVALGFETYLVMRHGSKNDDLVQKEIKSPENLKVIAGNNLGCYFCNDVTAPGDSLKDRTLDQQCTVSRPGISMIAGALAVELTISLLQNDLGADAPAFYNQSSAFPFDLSLEDNQCVLGIIPHSIRGFLSSFNHVLPATQKYNQCSACSSVVLKEFQERGFDFLCDVFNSSKYLEDLTGLTELYDEKNLVDVLEMSDGEDFSS